MIKVFILDKDNAIARFIEDNSAIISVYDDPLQALLAVKSIKPTIVIVNYTMQQATTSEFISLLFDASKQSKIVLIAKKLSDDEILDCLAAGAKGVMSFNDLELFVNRMIKAISADEAWISRRLVAKLLERVHCQQLAVSAA